MTIKLNAATGGGSVSLSAPNSTTSNLDVELTLPVDDGAANTFLKSDGSGTLSWASASSDTITEGNTTVECVDTGSNGTITFTTEGSPRATIDSSGRLLVGTSTARSNLVFGSPIQIEGTGLSNRSLAVTSSSSSGVRGGVLVLAHQKSGTIGGNTILGNGDSQGIISFEGNDGTNFLEGARIEAFVDGTPGTNDMPGRLVFSTTADNASSPTERMWIGSQGDHYIFCQEWGLTVSSATGPSNSDLFRGRRSATGIGGGTTVFEVQIDGDVYNATGTFSSFSDIKLKENIIDAQSQWDDVKSLRFVNYNFKEETGHPGHKQLGLVAQEVEQVCPSLVVEKEDTESVEVPIFDNEGNPVLDENGIQKVSNEERNTGEVTKSVKYSILYMKSVKALQEAMERIETLEASNADLAARLTALEGGAS